MKGYMLDVVNAFQSRVQHDPKSRQFITMPQGFYDWFLAEYPHVKLPSNNPKDLVVQTLTSFQGTCDASRQFYNLVKPVLIEFGFEVSTSDRGVFSRTEKDSKRSLVCVSTDDVLLLTPYRETYLGLRQHFQKYFEVTSSEGEKLRYLNLRIVFSKDGISIDQTDYIICHVMEYFGDTTSVPFESGPFPTDSKFELELFHSLPLSPDEKKIYEDHHNGSLSHWIGAFTHAVVFTRPDIAYATMRLSGYMAAPSAASYEALYQFMCYLYHHKHLPIMYPSKQPKTMKPVEMHWNRGAAELLAHTDKVDPLFENANDSEHARDLADRRSTTSIIYLYNGVTIHWSCKKQDTVARHSTGSELRALYDGVVYTVYLRSFMSSIGYPFSAPILTYEDNQATIASVLADRPMPNLKHLDVLVRALHEWKLDGHFIPAYTQSKCQLADVNTKPHEGQALERLVHQIIGVRFYPAQGTNHYKHGAFNLFYAK
jgi:hypothetical protein